MIEKNDKTKTVPLMSNKISVNYSIDKYHGAENFLASSSQY